MSSNLLTNKCSTCHTSLPLTSFVRNQQNNTYFKTCITCRTKRNVRRQNLRRQHSPAPRPPVTSINDTGHTGNENFADNIDPQIIDIDMELETNRRVNDITNLSNNPNDLATDTVLIFCNVCKKNCASTLFTGRIQGKVYKSCSDCRLRGSNRRHLQALQAPPQNGPHLPSGIKYNDLDEIFTN
ncbi:hypothetical protein EPUL_006346, partial [Erysiphe pulchra]